MATDTASADLNVRHALAREVCRALALLYSDGALSEPDREVVGRAIDVLQALRNRK